MLSAGVAEPDEYLDDPIKIVHCEQSWIKYMNERSEGIKIYHPNREQFRLSSTLRRLLENNINAVGVNTAYRSVKGVKLVDCVKYPWYFRKYTQQIIFKKHRLQNNVFSDTDNKLSVMEEVSDDDCIILDPPKIDLTYQNVYKFGSKTVSDRKKCIKDVNKDIEIRKALSRKKRNKNGIDFKRMIGLVGLKVTPKIEVTRDKVRCNYKQCFDQKCRFRKQNEDTKLLNVANKPLHTFRKRKNNVNSKSDRDKQLKRNKDFEQDLKQPDATIKINLTPQQKEEKQEHKNLDIHAITANKNTDEQSRKNKKFEQDQKLSNQPITLQRNNVVLKKIEEKEEIKNIIVLEKNSSEQLNIPTRKTVIQITNELSSPILPRKSFVKEQKHVDNLKCINSTEIQDGINKAIENASNELSEQDLKSSQNDRNNKNEIESKKLNYSFDAIEQKFTTQKKSCDKSGLHYYSSTYANNSVNTNSANVNKINSSADEANFKISTNHTNINNFVNYADVNNTNIYANSTNKNNFGNPNNKKHIFNSNNIKDSSNTTNINISAIPTNMNSSAHSTNTIFKKGSLQILSVDKINNSQDIYKTLKPTKISQGCSSLRQYHIVPKYKQNLIPHSVTYQNSGNAYIHNNKPSIIIPSQSQFGHLVSQTTSRPVLHNSYINESAYKMNPEKLARAPGINTTYSYANSLNPSQTSYRASEEFAPPNINIQSPEDTYLRPSNVNPYLSNHNLLPPQGWRWPYSTFSISQLLKTPPPPPSLPPSSRPQPSQPQSSQPQSSLPLSSSSFAHSTTLNRSQQILQYETHASEKCAVLNAYNNNIWHNSAHPIKKKIDNKSYTTQNTNRTDNNLNADKRFDSETNFSFLETVVTKSKMLEELDKIIMEENFDSDNINKSRDLIVQPKEESVPRQNAISKTEPLPKRVKMGEETDAFISKNDKNIASSKGYSPPILPIPPLYENILENLKSEHKNDNIKPINAVAIANSSSGDICKKNPSPRLQCESEDYKKITIDEYKRRTFKTCNEKNNCLSNTIGNDNCEYNKRKNDRNHSVESGYDSDTTVLISSIQL